MIERWTARRKVELLASIASLSEGRAARVLAEHGITGEELGEWRRLYAEHGRKGLRATRVQVYRGVKR